jgi:hypothetical protein
MMSCLPRQQIMIEWCPKLEILEVNSVENTTFERTNAPKPKIFQLSAPKQMKKKRTASKLQFWR